VAWTLAKALATPLALFSTEAVHKSVDNPTSRSQVLHQLSCAAFCWFRRQRQWRYGLRVSAMQALTTLYLHKSARLARCNVTNAVHRAPSAGHSVFGSS